MQSDNPAASPPLCEDGGGGRVGNVLSQTLSLKFRNNLAMLSMAPDSKQQIRRHLPFGPSLKPCLPLHQFLSLVLHTDAACVRRAAFQGSDRSVCVSVEICCAASFYLIFTRGALVFLPLIVKK